jgi:hypothetical protein
MAQQPHAKIIARLAQSRLRPAGLVQRGRSRIWLDDHGWWTTMVEFQPSFRSKGTFLNVGVDLHWYPQDFLSFDLGYREAEFVEFRDDGQFEGAVCAMMETALRKVCGYRNGLRDRPAASAFIVSYAFERPKSVWACYHRANAYAMAGSVEQAQAELESVLAADDEGIAWMQELHSHAARLLGLLPRRLDRFFDVLREYITSSRQMKKLSDFDCEFPP